MGLFSRKPKVSRVLRKLKQSGDYDFEISGESFHTANLLTIFKNLNMNSTSSQIVEATLSRDPLNDYDKNAVEVLIQNLLVGYIPKEQARKVSKLLDNPIDKGEATISAEVRRANEIGFSSVNLNLKWPPELLD
jgi:hypothetical protein